MSFPFSSYAARDFSAEAVQEQHPVRSASRFTRNDAAFAARDVPPVRRTAPVGEVEPLQVGFVTVIEKSSLESWTVDMII
jgi:hypothetical protein